MAVVRLDEILAHLITLESAVITVHDIDENLYTKLLEENRKKIQKAIKEEE